MRSGAKGSIGEAIMNVGGRQRVASLASVTLERGPLAKTRSASPPASPPA